MKYAYALSALLSTVSAHGVITQVKGANGVTMPGLSIQDGTPRDCASPLCGSEADTSIIRTFEMGGNRASALGRTIGGGPVDADAAIAMFMGGDKKKRANALDSLLGDLTGTADKGADSAKGADATGLDKGQESALGELAGGAKAGDDAGDNTKGVKTPKGTAEAGVSKAAGTGATKGLPTTADDGTITMTFHQVNADGAGPLTAQIDATSGGKDVQAFKDAKITQNVPGIGFGGLSLVSTTDFPVKVQMPAGMTCSGSAGGAQNVCIVRLQNAALAGPFGGSAAFTQSKGAKKRAIEYNLRKRHMARGVLGKADLE